MGDIWETTDKNIYVYQDKNPSVMAVRLKLELIYLRGSIADIYSDLRGKLTHKQIQDFLQGSGLPPAHMQLVKTLVNWCDADEVYFSDFVSIYRDKIRVSAKSN